MVAYRVTRGDTATDSMVIEITDCPTCGVLFGAPSRMLQERRRSGSAFYCPSGHSMSYTETTEQRLRKQLDAKQAELERTVTRLGAARDQAEAAERSNRALRGVVTKTRKRIGNGVCPCCNRHFADVERHMATKHADYAESAVEG